LIIFLQVPVWFKAGHLSCFMDYFKKLIEKNGKNYIFERYTQYEKNLNLAISMWIAFACIQTVTKIPEGVVLGFRNFVWASTLTIV
jgi:hypothetical protein